MTELINRLKEKLNGKTNIQDKLSAIVELVFQMTEEDPIKMQYMMFVKHTEIFDGSVPICMAKPFQMIEKIISEGVKSGILRNGNIEIMAASFISIPLKIIELKINGVINYPLNEVISQVNENCWRAIAK